MNCQTCRLHLDNNPVLLATLTAEHPERVQHVQDTLCSPECVADCREEWQE
jgi:hypothetical protein